MNSMATESSSREYRKIARARQEEETRLRITEAAVELHETVGPANTTITAIAELAGVSRMTVYNHFPAETDLFRACSSHWAEANPFPDPSAWTGIADPRDRLIRGLETLYAWYEAKADMLGNVFRDVAIVPALAEVMGELWSGYADGIVRTLAAGWRSPSEEGERVEGALSVAIDFNTWRLLAEAGTGPGTAARVASRLVTAGFEASGPAEAHSVDEGSNV
jgi:AcrR family transcriptional regulator